MGSVLAESASRCRPGQLAIPLPRSQWPLQWVDWCARMMPSSRHCNLGSRSTSSIVARGWRCAKQVLSKGGRSQAVAFASCRRSGPGPTPQTSSRAVE
eukprot:2835980-Alexandrium_andersonii.AAC.1